MRLRLAQLSRGKHPWLCIAAPLLAAIVCIGTAAARDVAKKDSPIDALPIVVARQAAPARARLDANVKQVLVVFEQAGAPFSAEERASLAKTAADPDDIALAEIQKIFDRHAVAYVNLNDEAWFTSQPASFDPKDRPLIQNRWSTFLVKLHNESRVTNPLEIRSAQAIGLQDGQKRASTVANGSCDPTPHGWAQWFELRALGPPLMPPSLSGTEIEYYPFQMCSLDAGDRAADLTFYLGGGPVSQGHYGSIGLLFKPSGSTSTQPQKAATKP